LIRSFFNGCRFFISIFTKLIVGKKMADWILRYRCSYDLSSDDDDDIDDDADIDVDDVLMLYCWSVGCWLEGSQERERWKVLHGRGATSVLLWMLKEV
jgi:hypothetical protein